MHSVGVWAVVGQHQGRVFYRAVREGVSEGKAFLLRPEGWGGANHTREGNGVPSKTNPQSNEDCSGNPAGSTGGQEAQERSSQGKGVKAENEVIHCEWNQIKVFWLSCTPQDPLVDAKGFVLLKVTETNTSKIKENIWTYTLPKSTPRTCLISTGKDAQYYN